MNKATGGMTVMLAVFGLLGGRTLAGTMDAPAAPGDSTSAMWTLDDIYNVLDTRTTNVAQRVSFMEPTGGPTNGTMHTLASIMALATNRSAVAKTGQTTSYAGRDDAALGLGVAWPNPRFTALGPAGTVATNQVRDNLTGLIWARNGNMFGMTNWGAAVTNCNNLNYGGQTDWRLPNIAEVCSVIAWRFTGPAICNTAGTAKYTTQGDPFISLQSSSYWTSSTRADNTSNAWYMAVNTGAAGGIAKTNQNAYVWPVRGGGQ